MRTLIVSDLHLGARTRTDLVQARAPRERLLEALAGADRVVLLGDTLELRQDPAREAVARACAPLLEMGAAVGDTEVIVVPGNHDYGLIAPWLDARGQDHPPGPLQLEQRVDPGEASPIATLVAGWLAPARVTVAYPGVWLRDDVYATHGHYLDCHATVPTLERLAAGVMKRLVAPLPEGPLGVDDYEALLAPVYAWMQAVTERTGAQFGIDSIRAWRLLAGGGRRRPLRARVLARAFPLGIAALNRVGLGPLSADLSRAALRRAGVQAMAEVCERLAIPAAHVVFGHSHRAGPLPEDDHAEWRAGRVSLVNSGCWVYEARFMAGVSPRSPFWPGAGVVLDDREPPRLTRFLEGVALPT